MPKKFINVWIISDEEHLYLNRCLGRIYYDEKLVRHIKKHLKIKVYNNYVIEMLDKEGDPDLILIDASMMQLAGYGDPVDELKALNKFVEKHSSSIIVLMSYVIDSAKDFFKELKEDLSKLAVIETCENGDESIAQYLADKVEQYYPYKGNNNG